MRFPRPISPTLPVSYLAGHFASPEKLVERVRRAPRSCSRRHSFLRHHLRRHHLHRIAPLVRPRRRPAPSSQSGCVISPFCCYCSVGTAQTVVCRVCCEEGEVVYRTRSRRHSRERGTSWTRKGAGTAARSAAREFCDGVSLYGRRRKDGLAPPVSGGSTSRGGRRRINQLKTPRDLPSQILSRTQRVMKDEERTTTSPNWKVLCWEKDICIRNTSKAGRRWTHREQ